MRRRAPAAVVAAVAFLVAAPAMARGEIEDYALATFEPGERGKVSPYAGFARRVIDERGFFAAVISSAETVEQPRPGVWRITVPDYRPTDPPLVCIAAIDATRRPGLTMAAIQARIGEVIAPGTVFERYAAAEMDSIESRSIQPWAGQAGKPGPKLAVWVGPRAGRYNAVGALPAPAGTLLIGCTGPTARAATQQMLSLFKPAAGLL